jgi:hypothetical protein
MLERCFCIAGVRRGRDRARRLTRVRALVTAKCGNGDVLRAVDCVSIDELPVSEIGEDLLKVAGVIGKDFDLEAARTIL